MLFASVGPCVYFEPLASFWVALLHSSFKQIWNWICFLFMTRWFFQALIFYPYRGMMDPKITTSISGWVFFNQPSFSWWCASPPVLASNVNLSCRLLFHGCVRHLSFVHLPEFTELYMWRYYLLLSSCNAFAPRFLAKNKRGMIGGAAALIGAPGVVVFFWDHFLDKQIWKNHRKWCGKNTDVFFKIDDDPMMIPSLIFVAGSLFSRTKGFHCQETHLVDQETQVLNVLIAMFLKYLSPVSYILTGTLAAAVYHLALFWCARVRLLNYPS